MAAHVSAHEGLEGLQSLHQTLFQACCQVFPRCPSKPRAVPWQTVPVQAGIKIMWQKWRAFKQVRKQGLRGWFQAWKAWKAFDHCYREHQRRCKVARRHVLLDAMHEAADCAAQHNSRGIYQIIKRIAPKQDRRRMQLRGEDGHMLLPQEELHLLEDHYQQRFNAQDPVDQHLHYRVWPGSGTISLDVQAVCRAIQDVPRRKAVPNGHPPSASWRLCADLISPWLVTNLQNLWNTSAIKVPRCWTDVDLALVPKPEKSGRSPKDYRPIGLACPLGKKVLGQLVQPHVPGILQHIKRFPQFAYQTGRSQFDALRRVFAHCAAVRHQLQQHTRNLHHRYQGHKPVPLFGALMLTVDLTQAFDRMPRSRLYEGMCRLELPQDLIHVLMAWHADIHYTIRHADSHRTFSSSQGIRQGCSVAPLLWLIFSHEVSCALSLKIGTDTLLRILTIFADDYHLADAFTSLPAFEHLLDVVAVLFRTLTAFGMEVSAGKSKAILALRGSLSNTIRKKYVRPATDGSGQVLRIQSRDQAFCIPLTSQFTYLGAQVSYSNFEQQTLTSRLTKGEACYHRLGAVLKGRHHLTQPQRLHLWRSCIWTTVAYGLTTCGLNEAGVQTLNTAMIKQLRAVLRLPAHISKTTNEEVCRQARLPLPNIMLRNLTQAEGRRHAARPPDELVCGPDHSWWSTVQHSLSPQVSKTLIRLAPSKVEAHVCPTCGVSYSTRAALKTHVTKQHANATETQPEVPGFSKLADSSGGLPRCKHCEKCFPTWQLLERHIAGGHCHARPVSDLPAKPSPMLESGPNVVADIKLAHHPDMLQLVTTYGPNFILHVAERHKYLQKCLICGQWLATSKVVKLHYKGSHPEVYQHTARASLECGKFPGSGCPCAYCGCKTKQPRHHKLQCSVLWQFCLQQYIILRVPPAKMTSPDLQHQEVFGSLATSQAAAFGAALLEGAELDQDLPNLPNKAARVGEGKRQRPRGGNPTYSSFGSHAERGGPGPRNHQAIIKAMGRLLLRQETSIQVLKQNSAWDLYLQPGSQGPLPMLFKASEAYREEAKNKRMDLPLRAQLLSTLFQTVLQCIQAIGTTPAQTKIVQAKGWMNQEGKWVYQRWDSSIQALVVDETRPPMEHQELVGLLGAMAASVRAKDVIHRFNATHQLSADQKGTSRFLLEVGLRAPGVAEVWMGLEKIQNLSALQVVGMQLRRDGLQRCNLAADLQKMLGGY